MPDYSVCRVFTVGLRKEVAQVTKAIKAVIKIIMNNYAIIIECYLLILFLEYGGKYDSNSNTW